MSNQQIYMLEKVASILELIPKTFVFTGGATIGLYVDEIVRADLRPTDDVDCVVEISTKGKYYQLAEKLRELGLEESTQPQAPLCRWQYQSIYLIFRISLIIEVYIIAIRFWEFQTLVQS